jgi:hypothetical protein
MQEALNNLHFKKIWEKVIMNRHPEAESLEEALVLEFSQVGCYYGLTKTTSHINIVNFDMSNKMGKIYDKTYNILGRPITLFDVLKLLQKNIENGEFALMTNCVVLCNIDVTRNTSNDIFQYFVKKICDINNKSNLIEEQTPETWEKIANLID